jgi:cytochrome c2
MRNRRLLKVWMSSLLLAVLGLATPCDLFAYFPPQPAAEDVVDDDEPVQVPGLLARYAAAGQTIVRRDPDIAFVWGSVPPDQRLASGRFSADWTGKLLIRLPGKYRIHAHVQGKVDVQLGGQLVLAGQSDQPQWISGNEFSFDYGEAPLQVKFHATTKESRVKLYWTSESIALEPIPSAALFMNEAHPELEQQERGRPLFAEYRCNRCHQASNDPPSPPGPDLRHLSMGVTSKWLEQWLLGGSTGIEHASMPEFGFTADETAALVEFLHKLTRDTSPALKIPAEKLDGLADAGRVLFHSLGCLACHSLNSNAAVGTGDLAGDAVGAVVAKESGGLRHPARLMDKADQRHPQVGWGGDLSRIGEKRTLQWLQLWLKTPWLYNEDFRMPVFTLKRDNKVDEPLQLAVFLSRQGKSVAEAAIPPASPVSQQLFDRGKKLFEAARCPACHQSGSLAADLKNVPTLARQISDLDLGCLQAQPDRTKWRPAYPQADQAAIRAYLATRTRLPSPEGPHERGQRLLTWGRCLSCHPRDGGNGIGPSALHAAETVDGLKGQGPLLVPPSLNAIGDKLLDDSLRKAVTGDFAGSRLPWLRVRMPKFRSSKEDAEALADYLIQHDRIDGPPAEIVAPIPVPQGDQRFPALSAGHTLLGSQGFSCIACHSFGTFVPRNTAPGTRGSDLRMIGQRMRRDFFLRWTKTPIRIVPNMEMPSFERPVEGILDGQLNSQLAALWESLHDENSSRPLEVSAVQQNLVVKDGEAARIVRDVFSVTQQGQEVHIPRSFAVGFSNQHNILIDLDTFRLREWWLGDFARQRTEGKSWFWDLGGVRVSTQLGRRSDLALLRGVDNSATLIEPLSRHGVCGTLQEYAPAELGVRLSYRVQFPGVTADQPLTLNVSETVSPMERENPTATRFGWRRSLTVTGIPEGYQPILTRPDIAGANGGFSVDPSEATASSWLKQVVALESGKREQLEFSRLKISDGKAASGTFSYIANTAPVVREAPQPIVQIATQEAIQTVPGYEAIRLPLPRSIMPTALTWTKAGVLTVASLKGHVYTVRDANQDGMEDQLDVFEEGLAAPYGVLPDENGTGLLVAHKPELLRLTDTNGDGRADLRQVVATGWGYNDNYHDWTCGIVRDSQGRMYVGLGSDYTQPKRPADQQRWRGKILRIDRSGNIEPIASGFRYPTGLAMTPDDELFVTDNQGEQNTFNELNHIVINGRYGVPSIEDQAQRTASSRRPAIQIPHPWTRSINGIFFLPRDAKLTSDSIHPFAGHGIGCEYDSRYLIRFTLQKVGETFQGAVYPFSLDQVPAETPNFEGTLCGGISPRGDIYIGCIHDSGWLGGLNVGSLYRLRQSGTIPLGIREIQAVSDGFLIDFTGSIDPATAADAKNYSISAYTREWRGTYATADSQRHQVGIKSVLIDKDQRRVVLRTDKLRAGFVYEITSGKIGADPKVGLWPATGHYTVNQVP